MNIYISNLSYGVSDADLQSVFSAYGEVSSASVVKFKDTGRSRGFGFVEMPDETAANKAIEELNQSELEGRTISVNVAKPQTDRPAYSDRSGDRRSSYGDRPKRY